MIAEPEEDLTYVSASEIYRRVEAWWDAEFDDKLIHRIINAPVGRQRDFYSSLWLPPPSIPLPDRPQGILRPILPGNCWTDRLNYRRTTLRLLLYTHEVVLNYEDFRDDFRPRDGHPYREDIGKLELPDSAAALKYWVKVRPFLEDGSIKLALVPGWYAAALGDDVRRIMNLPELSPYYEELLKQFDAGGYQSETLSEKGLEVVKEYAFGRAFGNLIGACRLAASNKTHMLALNLYDQAVISTFVGNRPLTGNRQSSLAKLAALKIPSMSADVNNLVELRKSDVHFAEWRKHLGDALSSVILLDRDDASLEEAANIVSRELQEGLMGIQKGVRRSPVLEALRVGSVGFAISGVSSVTTEVLTSDPVVGLAVGAAGAAADAPIAFATEYLKAREAQRSGRLIMDVSMLFNTNSRD